MKEFFRWSLILLIGSLILLLVTLLALRWVNPSATAFTLQENWQELEAERYSLRESWAGREELPEHLLWAAVAAEDQRFWDHYGFDVEQIREVMEERREGARSRGASTISQQVAKNLFLWPAESFFRKGIEAGITILIELFWSKERILEVYLNIAEFGPGVYGAGRASQAFFGVSPGDLTPEQSARLTAVLPSPKRMRVEPPSPYTQERSLWILRQMTQLSGVRYFPSEVKPDLPDELQEVQEAEPSPDELTAPEADDMPEALDEFVIPEELEEIESDEMGVPQEETSEEPEEATGSDTLRQEPSEQETDGLIPLQETP